MRSISAGTAFSMYGERRRRGAGRNQERMLPAISASPTIPSAHQRQEIRRVVTPTAVRALGGSVAEGPSVRRKSARSVVVRMVAAVIREVTAGAAALIVGAEASGLPTA